MIIISRCPYRVSLLGGSSDLDWFVNQYGHGLSLGFSIKLYSRVIVSYKESNERGILNYSSREEYKNIESISHPIIRSCLKRLNVQKKLELTSIGDIPSGSGLGSSSSFSGALVKAISELNSLGFNNHEIAHIASEIEIKDLGNNIGRQDQYLCALGGINVLGFHPGGKVNTIDIPNLRKAIQNFSKDLYLVDTTISRDATEKLSNLKKEKNSAKFIKNLLEIATQFIENCKSLNEKDIQELLEITMIKAWKIKRQMYGVMTQELINIEKNILKNDFYVLKLLGAGGGGYFLVLFKGSNIKESISKLEKCGLNLRKIELSNEGCSTCIF